MSHFWTHCSPRRDVVLIPVEVTLFERFRLTFMPMNSSSWRAILMLCFTLCPQSATGGTRAIDKMLHNQLSCLFWRQLLQRQDCLEHFSYVGKGQCWQHRHFQLAHQLRISESMLECLDEVKSIMEARLEMIESVRQKIVEGS